MRIDKQKRHEKFVQLVKQIIGGLHPDTQPLELDDHRWAALSQASWSERLGVTSRTLRSLAQIPPIVFTQAKVSGLRMVVYRLGDEPHTSFRTIALQMQAMLQKKNKQKYYNSHHFGCLIGLAETWPEGCQLDIFKYVINNWSDFMVGAKACTENDQHLGRYLELVSPPVLRKYPEVALDMYGTYLQGKGKAPAQSSPFPSLVTPAYGLSQSSE
jgi:hypothetical protein